VLLAGLAVGPPYWPLVFAGQAEVFAGAALVLAFVTFLAAKTTCEAACGNALAWHFGWI
jgi:hypothetical protein